MGVLTVVLVVAGIAVAVAVIFVVVRAVMAKKKRAPPQGALPPLRRQELPSPPESKGQTIEIVPRSTDTHVEYYSDEWHFAQPDRGTVSFDVQKDSGLVMTLCNAPGFPTTGYALTIDKRGGVSTNFLDTTTSMTYVSRLPTMDAPLNSSASVRNVELDADTPHHFDISYVHGYLEVKCDGNKVLACTDSLPTPGVQYVGFGDCGMRSGVGLVTNLVIH